MNHEFFIKMAKAKRLEYEALKEIMPEKAAKRINHLESEVLGIVKEYIINGFNDYESKEGFEKKKTKNRESKENDKKIKKVSIES